MQLAGNLVQQLASTRVGEVDAWQERLSKGIDAMVTIVIEGLLGGNATTWGQSEFER